MGYQGDEIETDFSATRSEGQGTNKNQFNAKQVDLLNTFIVLNATELNALYEPLIPKFISVLQTFYG
ncbi:MAG: hypothetical protein ACRCXY_11400 [Fusobacteriaceae bacterium]